MAHTSRIVIVGGGLEGCSIAWNLARQGETDVTVLEKSSILSGMSGRSSGIVRCHYGAPSVAALSLYSTSVFHNAPELLGDDMGFRNVGFLVCVGEENTEAFRKNIEMQRGLGINTGYIEAGEAEKLYPGMNTDDLALIAYEPDGGRGDGYLAGMAFANAARSLGVTLRPNHPVVELLRDSTGRVYGAKTAAGDEFHADTVILTNGCWAAPLAATAGVDVPVQVHAAEIVVIDPGAPLPVVPVLSDLQQMQYVVREPNAMVHAGDSGPRDYLMIDPDHLPAAAQDSVIETLIKKMLHRFPDMPNPSVARTYTGGIDGTPDGNPIIGPSPVDGLFLAVGFSGHGFKLSPGIGKLAADLVLRGETDIPNVVAADFRYGRYEDGEPLHGLHPYVGANAIH